MHSEGLGSWQDRPRRAQASATCLTCVKLRLRDASELVLERQAPSPLSLRWFIKQDGSFVPKGQYKLEAQQITDMSTRRSFHQDSSDSGRKWQMGPVEEKSTKRIFLFVTHCWNQESKRALCSLKFPLFGHYQRVTSLRHSNYKSSKMPRVACSRDSKGNCAEGGKVSYADCVISPQPVLEELLVNFSTFPSRKHHVSEAPLQVHAGMWLQR